MRVQIPWKKGGRGGGGREGSVIHVINKKISNLQNEVISNHSSEVSVKCKTNPTTFAFTKVDKDHLCLL